MGRLYNFSRLVKKYSVNCEICIDGKSHWESGELIKDKSTIRPYKCAIIPMTEKQINNSGGDYKAGDCDIVALEPLPADKDVFILYKGKTYKVMQNSDYSDYADFYGYIGKRVSGFDKS